MYAQPVYMYMYIHVHVCVLSQWDECTQSGCNIDHLVSVNTAASKDSSCVRVTQCVCMCVCVCLFSYAKSYIVFTINADADSLC